MAILIDELSVFFPAYNEEANIRNTVLVAANLLEKIADKWEIIIVDDGSKDNTPRVSDDLARSDERIRVLHHKVNKGYGAALQSGFYQSKYNWVAYNDSDGQFDFGEITKFIAEKDKGDLLLGYRIKRRDSFYRLFLAKGWSLCVFLFFGLRLKDVDCGFKMVKRQVLDNIPRLESERGGMINAELAIKAKENGFRIKQIGVSHYPRRAGRATGASLNVIVKSFIDLFKLWKELKLG